MRWCAGLGMVRRRRPLLVGYVDHVGGGLIRGWASDMRAPNARLALDVFCRGIFLGCARAGGFRKDLLDQGLGDGCYGFVFHSPAFSAESGAADGVEVVTTDVSRFRLAVSTGSQAAVSRDRLDAADVRSFFGPLLVTLQRRAADPVGQRVVPSVRHLDILCAPGSDGSASAFADHIADKYERATAAADPAGFWSWYLNVYGVERSGRVPLSATDVDRLRRHGPVAERTDRYAWAVHETRRLRVEDCLVAASTCDNLASVPLAGRLGAFPLSRFMRRFRARHHLLQQIKVATAQDRIALYTVVMLFALHDVHYLRYVPAHWLTRMLDAGPDGSPFEGAQRSILGAPIPVMTNDRYRNHIRARGFDLATLRFSTTSDQGHRIEALASPPGATVDVQMIGPFSQSLGLAESCRRIASALGRGGRPVNLVDYAVGLSAPGTPSDLTTSAIRKARLNVLHLNAEEVPEALASLPDVFSAAHTILVPYWELSKPSSVHRLGLQLVDEVWGTSHFLTRVFAGARPVTHIGMSYDARFIVGKAEARALLAREGIVLDGFTVLTISDALSWTRRKNVRGAIEAFQAAFADDPGVRLIVKTRNVRAALSASQAEDWRMIVALCKDDRRITVIDASLCDREQKALLCGADCLLSLHRAEGLGLDMLDALHCGTPVVATAYSGNMDVCNTETAWLVDHDLKPVERGQYAFAEPGQVWAEPRLEAAVAALRGVRGDAETRARKSAAAQAHVRVEAAPEVLATRLALLLDARLAASRGAPPRYDRHLADQLVSGSILPR